MHLLLAAVHKGKPMRPIHAELSRHLKLLSPPSTFDELVALAPQRPEGAARLSIWLRQQPATLERALDLYNQQAWVARGTAAAPQLHTLEQALVGGALRLHACTVLACIESVYNCVPSPKSELLTRLSVRTAQVAGALASLVGESPNDAFMAGMLHAVGERALHATMPDAMSVLDQDVSAERLQRPEVQRNFWGFDYADAGGALLAHWQFAPCHVQAVAMQLEPLAAHQHQMLGAVVSLASWRVRVELSGQQLRDMAVCYPQQVALLLGLDDDILLGELPLFTSPRKGEATGLARA